VVLATPRGDQALDYYDYGASIQITLPPCAGGFIAPATRRSC
jgi:hypothetical protein